MQAPSPAYQRMREAYARWFWKVPAGQVLAGLGALLVAMATLAQARHKPVRVWLSLGLLALGVHNVGLHVLTDAAKDRALYEVNKETYDAEG